MTTEFKTRCWRCGRENPLVTAPDEPNAVPADGDVTICFSCGALAIFDSGMPDGLRKPSPSESDQLREQEEVHRMIVAWHRTQQEMRRVKSK